MDSRPVRIRSSLIASVSLLPLSAGGASYFLGSESEAVAKSGGDGGVAPDVIDESPAPTVSAAKLGAAASRLREGLATLDRAKSPAERDPAGRIILEAAEQVAREREARGETDPVLIVITGVPRSQDDNKG